MAYDFWHHKYICPPHEPWYKTPPRGPHHIVSPSCPRLTPPLQWTPRHIVFCVVLWVKTQHLEHHGGEGGQVTH